MTTQTCSGCCFGDECLGGTDPAACGVNGAVCGNCLATGGKWLKVSPLLEQLVAEGKGFASVGQ